MDLIRRATLQRSRGTRDEANDELPTMIECKAPERSGARKKKDGTAPERRTDPITTEPVV